MTSFAPSRKHRKTFVNLSQSERFYSLKRFAPSLLGAHSKDSVSYLRDIHKVMLVVALFTEAKE